MERRRLETIINRSRAWDRSPYYVRMFIVHSFGASALHRAEACTLLGFTRGALVGFRCLFFI